MTTNPSNTTNSSNHIERKRLTNDERQSVFEALLKESKDGEYKRGSAVTIAAKFFVSEKTVHRIWEQARNCISGGSVNVSNRLTGRTGRKRIQINPIRIYEIPLRHRTNIRSMSAELNMAKSTVHRRIKEGFMRPHSNALKPTLTDDNKRTRLQFCLSMLEQESLNGTPTFKNMLNYVHIDEKWFYMTKEAERYYLLPEEEEPLRACKSKRYITKVMFLAVVARPRFDSLGNEEFSGKIGIFPFTFKEPAKRRSKNRDAGTLETKSVNSITKEVFRECLIEKVLPAIRAKWPSHSNMDPIFIQMDNAKPHIKVDDVEFVQAASSNGFDIRLCFQPPNSPDLNVLDLGFFRAIQSLQHQEAPTTIDELVQAVEKSFDNFSSQSLNFVFLSLQNCMIEIMTSLGANRYKVLPHMGKERQQRNGTLPFQLQVEVEHVQNVLNHLAE